MASHTERQASRYGCGPLPDIVDYRLFDCQTTVCQDGEMCFWNTGMQYWGFLAAFLFTLYTSNFRYNSESCHIQKYSDDTAVVACVRGGQENEYRNLVESFYGWTNTTEIGELVADFRRSKTPYQSVCIDGGEIETVQTCKYLEVVLNNKLEWSANIEVWEIKALTLLHILHE